MLPELARQPWDSFFVWILVSSLVVALPFFVFAAFFNLSVFDPKLLLVVLLGTIGFAAVGTLFAAVAVHTRTREVMLPILLLPVAVPVLVAAVKATGEAIARTPPSTPGTMRFLMRTLAKVPRVITRSLPRREP